MIIPSNVQQLNNNSFDRAGGIPQAILQNTRRECDKWEQIKTLPRDIQEPDLNHPEYGAPVSCIRIQDEVGLTRHFDCQFVKDREKITISLVRGFLNNQAPTWYWEEPHHIAHIRVGRSEEFEKEIQTMTEIGKRVSAHLAENAHAFAPGDARTILEFLGKKDSDPIYFCAKRLDGVVVNKIFTDISSFLAECERQHRNAQIWVGLNPINPDTMLIKNGTPKDEDILNRLTVLFDIDIAHEENDPLKKEAATNIEVENARLVSESVITDLRAKGIEPLVNFSGNGWHIIVKTIPYPNTPEFKDRTELLLECMNRKHGNKDAKIDTCVFDARRVVKVPGTLSVKGSNTSDRPWRMSRVVEMPDTEKAYDIFELYKFEITEYAIADQFSNGDGYPIDTDPKWKADYKGDFKSLDILQLSKEKGAFRYQINNHAFAVHCPNERQHTTGIGGAVILMPHGKWEHPALKCHHDHCKNIKLKHYLSQWAKEDVEKYFSKPFTKRVEIPEFVPLIHPKQKAARYPMEALGNGILGQAANVARDCVQAPDAVAAQSFLAVAALLAQPHVDATIDGRLIPASEYYITVAESGDRKTATDNIALSEISKFEQEKLIEYRPLKDQYLAEMQIFNRQKTKDMSKIPQKPMCPMMLVQEPTLQGLHKLYIDGQGSLGLFSNEGGRMLGGHGMNRDNQQMTACGLSELWDGSPISRVRSGEFAEKLYGRRLSMHLLCQPVIADNLFDNGLLLGQGFLARTLSWIPESLAGRSFRVPSPPSYWRPWPRRVPWLPGACRRAWESG